MTTDKSLRNKKQTYQGHNKDHKFSSDDSDTALYHLPVLKKPSSELKIDHCFVQNIIWKNHQ